MDFVVIWICGCAVGFAVCWFWLSNKVQDYKYEAGLYKYNYMQIKKQHSILKRSVDGAVKDGD